MYDVSTVNAYTRGGLSIPTADMAVNIVFPRIISGVSDLGNGAYTLQCSSIDRARIVLWGV